MPTVNAYGGRKVDTAPLPGVRKQASETAQSAGVYAAEAEAGTGQAIAGLAQDVGHATGQILQMQAEARKQAIDLSVMKADTGLGQWELKRVYDPDTGALTVKGEAAMGLPEQINGEFNEVADAIEADLHTPEARAAFQKVRAQRGLSLTAQMRRHTFGEIQRVEGEVLQATVETASASAMANATDPDRVHLEMARGVTALQTSAPRLGKSPEEVQREIDKFTTATHEGVVNNLLSAGQHQKARAWFEEAKKEGGITGEAVGRMQKAVNAGEDQAAAQSLSDEIIAQGGTLTEQLARAAKANPDIRPAVESRIEHNYQLGKSLKQEAEQAMADKAYFHIDHGGTVDDLPPQVQEQLGSLLPALRSFQRSKAEGVPIKTDQTTYYRLKEAATTDPEAFLRANLLQYRDRLSDSDFQELTNLRGIVRSGDQKKIKSALGGFSTNKDIWDSTLKAFKIDPDTKKDPAKDETLWQIRRQLDTYVEDAQANGVKLSDDLVQKKLTSILADTIPVPGAWWGTKQVPLVTVPIEQIPARDRQLIEQALRADHQPVTDQTIRERYITRWLKAHADRKVY